MIRVFLLDVYKCKAKVVEIEPDDLDQMYRLLDCRCIDIVTRTVGGKRFDVVCDDEGLFHEPQKISAVDKLGQPMLVGNLIFAHHDAEGNLTGLEEGDLDVLTKNSVIGFASNFPDGYWLIRNMDWR